MRHNLYGYAHVMPTVRQIVPRNLVTLIKLAYQHDMNPKTVLEWRKRAFVERAQMRLCLGRGNPLFSLIFKLFPSAVKRCSVMIAYKVSKNARILSVGINPHPSSYRREAPFSNNKMFWYLLNRAGLLKEIDGNLKEDKSLKRVYFNKFISEHELNLLNLIDRPTKDVTELKKGEEMAGIKRVLRAIRTYKLRVVCFIGKITFNIFRGCRACGYGWQKNIDNPRGLFHVFFDP